MDAPAPPAGAWGLPPSNNQVTEPISEDFTLALWDPSGDLGNNTGYLLSAPLF